MNWRLILWKVEFKECYKRQHGWKCQLIVLGWRGEAFPVVFHRKLKNSKIGNGLYNWWEVTSSRILFFLTNHGIGVTLPMPLFIRNCLCWEHVAPDGNPQNNGHQITQELFYFERTKINQLRFRLNNKWKDWTKKIIRTFDAKLNPSIFLT